MFEEKAVILKEFFPSLLVSFPCLKAYKTILSYLFRFSLGCVSNLHLVKQNEKSSRKSAKKADKINILT